MGFGCKCVILAFSECHWLLLSFKGKTGADCSFLVPGTESVPETWPPVPAQLVGQGLRHPDTPQPITPKSTDHCSGDTEDVHAHTNVHIPMGAGEAILGHDAWISADLII